MNVKWHEQHVMPPRATLEQRIAWHREHQLACACRPIPARLQALMQGEEKSKRSAAEAHASASAGAPAKKRGARKAPTKQARVTKLTARKKPRARAG